MRRATRWIGAWLLLIAALVLPAPVRAQPTPSPGLLQPEIDTSSPRATYESFFRDLQRLAGLYERYVSERSNAAQYRLFRGVQRLGARVLDLSDLPPATRLKHTTVAVGYLADILLRLPPIPPEQIPGTPPLAAADLPAPTW